MYLLEVVMSSFTLNVTGSPWDKIQVQLVFGHVQLGPPFSLYTNLALTQVALIVALCCVDHIWSMVVVPVAVDACCCCIPCQLALTLALNFAPCVLTFAPCILTFETSHLCGFPSFHWCKHSACTGGGCHQLQLVPVVLLHSATSTDSALAHVVVSLSATCTGGAFSSSYWCKTCTCSWATCIVWWWSVVVICSSMWRWRYKYAYM